MLKRAALASIGVSLSAMPGADGQIAFAQGDIGAIVLQTYRDLHEHPELGMQETFAHAYLTRRIRGLPGMRLIDLPALPTAVLALLDSGRPGPTIALRAELDARRLDAGVVEPLDHDPRSRIDGLMHNCGHDAHAAMLLGAATELSLARRLLTGRILFVFQPAEEIAGGAEDIIASGILETCDVRAIFAQHCVPGLSVGDIQLSRGSFLAGSTAFTLRLVGDPSHAAAPFDGADLPVVAARFISELAVLPARRLDMLNRPAVISTTQMSTNAETLNGLPSEVVLSGTIRAFEDLEGSSGSEPSIAGLIRSRVDGLAAAFGVSASIELRRGSPPTRNDEDLHDLIMPLLQTQLSGGVQASSYRGMFSEDFAFYSERLPALYFSLGVMKDGLGVNGVHRPDFTIHPDALAVGTRLLVALARTVGPRLPV